MLNLDWAWWAAGLLIVLVARTSVAATDPYTTGINVPTTTYTCNGAGVGACDRIEPGNTALSAVSQRMGSRVAATQMPPLGTELVHTEGVNAVNAWITGL